MAQYHLPVMLLWAFLTAPVDPQPPSAPDKDLERAKSELEAREQEFGPKHPEVGDALSTLGNRLCQAERFHEALAVFERFLLIAEVHHGQNHLKTAQAHFQIGAQLASLGRHEDALASYETALAICESHEEPNAQAIRDILNNIAFLFMKRAEHAEARPYFLRALRLAREGNPTGIARALNNLGGLCLEEGDYAEARSYFEEALETCIAEGKEDNSLTLSIRGNTAIALRQLGYLTRAAAVQQSVLQSRVRTAGAMHPSVALAANNVGRALSSLGRYAEAQAYYERAILISNNHPDGQDRRAATYLSNLASTLVRMGDFSAARPRIEQALASSRRDLGPNHPRTAQTMVMLGDLLARQGNDSEAAAMYRDALRIREEAFADDHPMVATTLVKLAWMLRRAGFVDDARGHAARALQIRRDRFGDAHPAVASSLVSLGEIDQTVGDLASAARRFESAFKIRREQLGLDHPLTLDSRKRLGELRRREGKSKDAIAILVPTASKLELVLGPANPETTRAYTQLALAHIDLRQHESAVSVLLRVLRNQDSHRRTIEWSMSEQDRILYARRQAGSLRTLLSVPAESLSARDRMAIYETVRQWKAHVFRGLTSSLGIVRASVDPALRDRVERLHKVQSDLSKLLFARPSGSDSDRREQIDEMRTKVNELERDIYRMSAADHRREMGSSQPLNEILPSGSVAIDFFVSRRYIPASMDDKGNLSAPGHWGENGLGHSRVTAWITRAGNPETYRVEMGHAQPIMDAVEAFRTHIRTPSRPGRAPSDLFDRARTLLLSPLEPYLDGAEVIYVSPDRFLASVPFEALRAKDGKYLIEHHRFVHAHDLVSHRKSVTSSVPVSSRHERLLVVSDVDYDNSPQEHFAVEGSSNPAPASTIDSSGPGQGLALGTVQRGGSQNRWERLRGTGSEGTAVVRLHERSFPSQSAVRLQLQRTAATEERVKHEMPDYDVVHVATHGFFEPAGLPTMWQNSTSLDDEDSGPGALPDDDLTALLPGYLSGLVLAGANDRRRDGRDDGMLTADETSSLDLSGVDLVVLSACETALGTPVSGEGLLGLLRAFRLAGAKRVVSTLWRVGDATCADLMTRFYQFLWIEGRSPSIALHEAKLEVLRNNRRAYAGDGRPATWAAFIVSEQVR